MKVQRMNKITITIILSLVCFSLSSLACFASNYEIYHVSERHYESGSQGSGYSFSWLDSNSSLALSGKKGLDKGTSTAIGASLGALMMSIVTFCGDGFRFYSSHQCSLVSIPAIIFGALAGGAAGYALVYQSEHTMVAYRASF